MTDYKKLVVRRNVLNDLESFMEDVSKKASKYKNIINISYLSEREAVIIYKE